MKKKAGNPDDPPMRVNFALDKEAHDAIRQVIEQAGGSRTDMVRDAISALSAMRHTNIAFVDSALMNAMRRAAHREGLSAVERPIAVRPDVFLCHASEDKEFVRKLADDLERLGIRAWLDEWEINPGDSLLDKIGTGINSAKWFCVVLSKASLRSRWCQTELREALNNEIEGTRRKIIPIKYEDVAVPPFVKGKRYITFDPSYFHGLLQLGCAMRGISPRVASMHIARSRAESLDAVVQIVEKYGNEPVHRFGDDDWRDLRAVLSRRGIRISDRIEIRDRRTGRNFIAS